MTKKLEDFYKDLGLRESSGRYDVVNQFGYIGKYQMGEAALVDLGYYKEDENNKNYYKNDWKGQFTGKDGIYSKQDFLNNHDIQEKAQIEYKKIQWNQLKKEGADKYVGKTINGIKVTQSGLLAAAHLKGASFVASYLSGNNKETTKDKFGTDVKDYLAKFADYDVSEITGLPNDSDDKEIKGNEKSPKEEKSQQKDEKSTDSSSKNIDKNLSDNSDFRQIINDLSRPDRIILNSILYAFEHTDKGFSNKHKLMYTLPKVLRAVANVNNMSLTDVTDLLIKSIKNHKRNQEIQEGRISTPTMGSGNGHWVTINGNHVFIEDK